MLLKPKRTQTSARGRLTNGKGGSEMIQTMRYLALTGLLVMSLGCGKQNAAIVAAGADSKKVEAEADTGGIKPILEGETITVRAGDLETYPDDKYAMWILALPRAENLKGFRQMTVVSAELAKYTFNEVDMYLDRYDENDKPMRMMFEAIQPLAVLEKDAKHVRFWFPGKNVGRMVEDIVSGIEDDECHRIRLRILLTDRTKPGNPIQVILNSTVWEKEELK